MRPRAVFGDSPKTQAASIWLLWLAKRSGNAVGLLQSFSQPAHAGRMFPPMQIGHLQRRSRAIVLRSQLDW